MLQLLLSSLPDFPERSDFLNKIQSPSIIQDHRARSLDQISLSISAHGTFTNSIKSRWSDVKEEPKRGYANDARN